MSDELDPKWHRISRFRPDAVDIGRLLKLLKHEDWQVRLNAAREISFHPDARALEQLMTMFKQEQDSSVHHMVGLALDALEKAGIPVPIFAELTDATLDVRRQIAIQRLRELKVEVKTDNPNHIQLMIPHELNGSQFLEVGYLMAQLTDLPFPETYAPLAETVPSSVLPRRGNPSVDFVDSYLHGMKFRIYRKPR